MLQFVDSDTGLMSTSIAAVGYGMPVPSRIADSSRQFDRQSSGYSCQSQAMPISDFAPKL